MSTSNEPLISPRTKLPEFTLRVFLFSVLLAALLAASDAYLALKIGMTIAASIPASVLALGLLRLFKNSNVLESNLIQTAASAGEGIAAAAAFVLPALIILRIWNHFPYWETFFLISIGSILGAMFSIPLRRVLLALPDLRFPEGTAVGNLLRVSVGGGSGLKQLVRGSMAGVIIAFAQTALKLVSDTIQVWFPVGNTLMGMGMGFTPAAIAAGYIVGIEVGIALLVGTLFGWLFLIPYLGWSFGYDHSVSYYDAVMGLWSKHLRYVGVGTMLVGGFWTFIRLLKVISRGLSNSYRSAKKQNTQNYVLRTEKDIPFNFVIMGVVLSAILFYVFYIHYFHSVQLSYPSSYFIWLAFPLMLFTLVLGFFVSVIVGYFGGLVGVSNNPLSGILIMTILLLGGVTYFLLPVNTQAEAGKVASVLIMITTAVGVISVITMENIQDLKAGQMVGATPWKQQLMIIIGGIVSAVVTGPVLQILLHAYGMGGVFPRAGMDPSQMLSAPQASLFAALAQAISGHQALPMKMIIIGAIFAAIIIVIDEILKAKGRFRLPALAVGLGIYIPPEMMLPITVGGFVSYLVKKKTKTATHANNGILLACGLVAGSALIGVILAVPFVLLGSSDALSLMPKALSWIADLLGLVSLLIMCIWLYRVGISKNELK